MGTAFFVPCEKSDIPDFFILSENRPGLTYPRMGRKMFSIFKVSGGIKMQKIKGLTDEEARISREKNGGNSLTEQKREGFLHKLLGNFGDPMIKILCVALLMNVIFVLLHYFAGIGDTEWYETAGIAAAVLIATFVSTLSEHKNENAFRKLQEEASVIRCKVYRNDGVTELPITDIVVGDKVLLQSGDKIPADGYIIDGCIHADQSALNGESKAAVKSTSGSGKAEKPDFLDSSSVFRGAVVSYGSAVMDVTTVGDSSVYGQIAKELQQDDDRPSPLKIKLSKLANDISRFGYFGGAAIAVVYLINVFFLHDGGAAAYFSSPDLWLNILKDIVQAVMFAVIIIVMAVPEGLPLMIAIVSSMNMKKMLKDNVLVRKVTGLETAGSLNILFSDKTGTITKGQLETVLFVDGQGHESKSFDEIDRPLAEKLYTAIRYNTDAVITVSENSRSIVGGNPTERAMLSFTAAGESFDRGNIRQVSSLPFSSENKYSASTVSGADERTFIKGAPERLLPRCKACFDKNGRKITLDRKALEKKIDSLAERAIRVLAVAVSDSAIENGALPEGELTLIGLLGIRDELRPESVNAIKEVTDAGIQVVMITGDRKETAVAVARDAGLLRSDESIVLTSGELAEMTDDQVKAAIPHLSVIARALPSDKTRLVRLSQELGLVAGMTGDGVNDSPALKKADVGFAMGGGTEVAKEAADIVILDDNFISISKAVLYGRTIFNNIRKFISFQLAINLSAVLVSFIMPLLGLANPLSITQILWVNLVMDTLAALALGGEPALHRYMKEKPKRRDEHIVCRSMRGQLCVSTLWILAVSLFILISQLWAENPLTYIIRFDSFERGGTAYFPHLMTVYFTFFILISVFNSLNVRTDKLNLFEHITENKLFFVIMGLIVLIQVIMVYFGGEIFSCYGLNLSEWLFVIAASVSIIPVSLVYKLITKNKF